MSGILFWPQCFHCMRLSAMLLLTNCWGRVTHVCVGNLTIIGSDNHDNGLSPDRHQAIIWTHDGIMLIGPLEINFSEILIKIHTFHLRKCISKYRLRKGSHFVQGETSQPLTCLSAMLREWWAHAWKHAPFNKARQEQRYCHSFNNPFSPALTSCWIISRVAGDLRHRDAHVTSLMSRSAGKNDSLFGKCNWCLKSLWLQQTSYRLMNYLYSIDFKSILAPCQSC